MTPPPRERTDPFVLTLARILREVADREMAERDARRAKMRVMDAKRQDEAA